MPTTSCWPHGQQRLAGQTAKTLILFAWQELAWLSAPASALCAPPMAPAVLGSVANDVFQPTCRKLWSARSALTWTSMSSAVSLQGDACNAVSFEQHNILIQETEASVLWILYAPRSHGSFQLCPRLARNVLARLSGLFSLLHRPVLQVIEHSGVLTCRSLLSLFLKEYMPVFEGKPTGSWCTMHDLYAAMCPHRGLPMTIIAGETFRGAAPPLACSTVMVRVPPFCTGSPLHRCCSVPCEHAGVQALLASLAASEAVPGRRTVGVMLLHKHAVLHTNLDAADAAALYLFASSTVIPVTRAENKTTRPLQQLYQNVTDWGKTADSALAGAAWHMAKGSEHAGLLTYGAEGSSRPGMCPLLYTSAGDACRLVAWQHAGFQVRLCRTLHQAMQPLVRCGTSAHAQ